jgi:hypothetical protein
LPELDSVLTLSQRQLGVMQPRPLATLHVGGGLKVDGNVDLPANSIQTSEISAGACQQMIGSYAAGLSWSLASASVWTETPVQANCTFTGALARFEFNVLLSCPTKASRTFWSIMIDGAQPPYSAGAADAPENNYAFMADGVFYATPAAGTRRVSFAVYGIVGVQIYNSIASTLYVTEQRR